jgi:hypothetical protein
VNKPKLFAAPPHWLNNVQLIALSVIFALPLKLVLYNGASITGA